MGMYATLKRFTMLSILGIFCAMFSLVMASIFELIPVWLSIDMMVTQTLIMFMYKIHNGWYISCCGRLENFCVRPQFMKYFACNFCCFKMDNIVNNKMSVPKESPISEMTENKSDQIELEVNSVLSTRKGNTPRPTKEEETEEKVSGGEQVGNNIKFSC